MAAKMNCNMKFRLQFPGITKTYLGLLTTVLLLLPLFISLRQIVSYEGGIAYIQPESELIKINNEKIPYLTIVPSSIIIVILATIAWQNFKQRQKLAIALQESEAKFSHILATIPDPMWIATLAEGKLLRVNKAMVDFIGYSEQEIVGKTCLELTMWNNPEDLTEFREKLRHNGITKDFEVIFRLASGKLSTVLLSGSITSFQEQDCVIGVLKDITQRQEIEAQLKEQEIFLRSIYEGVEHSVFVVDVTQDGEFRFVSINPANQKLTGFTLESIQGKTPAEAQLPSWEAITQHYQDCLDAGETISYEEEIMLQGRQTYWYTSLTPLYNLEGRVYRLIGTAVNINKLKEIQAQLQHIFTISPVVIYSVVENPGQTIRFEQLSQAFEEILEVTLALAAEDPEIAFKQIHPEDKDGYIQAVTNALAQMQVFNHQWRIITPSGKIKWLEGTSRPEQRDNGEIVWHGVVQDISDRRRIELELQAKTEELDSSKNQLSRILNSSLDGIMAFEAIRDEEGKIIDFEYLLTNPTACTLVGKSESELIGNRLLEIFPGHTSEELFAAYVEVVESGQPLQTEIYYQHDGIDAWFDIMAVKLNNGFAVTFSNVTQIKESEKALQQANQQLEKQIDTLKRRNQEMLLLSEMSDFLQTCLTVEEACLAIADLIQPLFPGCGGSVFLGNPFSKQIEKIASWGQDLNQQKSFAVEDCWGLRRGRSHWVDQNRFKLCCKHLGSIHSLAGSLCIPLLALGKTLGLLYLSAEQEEFLSPNKQQLARMVGEQIANVIANLQLRATLEYQSIRDTLTGLYNRRYLDIS